MTGQNGQRNGVLIGSAFAIGLASGFLLKDAATQLYKRARSAWWHREYERTFPISSNAGSLSRGRGSHATAAPARSACHRSVPSSRSR